MSAFTMTPDRILDDPRIPSTPKLLYLALLKAAFEQGARPGDAGPLACLPDNRRLMIRCACSEDSLARHLRKLEQLGLVRLAKTRGGPRAPVRLLVGFHGEDRPVGEITEREASELRKMRSFAGKPQGPNSAKCGDETPQNAGSNSAKCGVPPIRDSSDMKREKSPPNPPTGGKPEGGSSISSPGKTGDPGTEARSSDSRPSGQSAQQAPPVPPAPPEAKADIGQAAARVAIDHYPEAVRGEVGGALRRAARKASQDGASDEKILEAARYAVGSVRGDASNLAGCVVGRFRSKLADLAEALPEPTPKAVPSATGPVTWDMLPAAERESYDKAARRTMQLLRTRKEVVEGVSHADAAEFVAQSGWKYSEFKLSGRLYRYIEGQDRNFFTMLEGSLNGVLRRAYLDLARATWESEKDGKKDVDCALKLALEVIRYVRNDPSEEAARKTFDPARVATECREELPSQWSPEGRAILKKRREEAAKPAPGPYNEEEDDRNPIPINSNFADKPSLFADKPSVAPQPPAPPPPQPPAPMDHLERAKANAERLAHARRFGGVHIADLTPIAIPQSATA